MLRRVIVIALAVAALVAVIRYADFRTVGAALADMRPIYLALIAGLLLAGALLRAFRWSFYLRSAGLDIRWRDGVTSYLAAMSASALPGSSLLSARLAQEHGHVRMRQATPAVFVSYVADAIALSALALGFSVLTHQPPGRFVVAGAGLALSAALIVMGRSARVWTWVARLLARFRLTRGWLPKEEDVHERVAALMRLSVVARGVILSLLTTFLSILLLVTFVDALTVRGISLLEGATVHTIAETVGVVLPIAVGFSISDSSLAGMLNALGIGWVRVVFILLTMRSLGLLFKTLFGVGVLLLCYRRLLASALNLRGRARSARRHCGRAWRLGGKLTALLSSRRAGRPSPPPQSREGAPVIVTPPAAGPQRRPRKSSTYTTPGGD